MARLNVEAVVDLMGRYLEPMRSRGRGAVINLASMAAFQPLPNNATYAATKAFVLSLSEATHEEFKSSGVTITAVCPGPVRTEFPEVAGMGDAESRTPDFVWTAPEDVAEQALGGAEAGKRVVVPGGVLNQATALAGQHSPRMLLLPIAQRVWRRAGSSRS
jgi:short-subunit dehydrogenase